MRQSLQAIRSDVEETNAVIVKQCEVAVRSFEESPPMMKETLSLVEDPDAINNLSSEVEILKVMQMDVPLVYILFMSASLQSC